MTESDFGYYRMVKNNICEWLGSKLRCFGEWSLNVLCGSFGAKEIHIPLKGMKDQFMNWSFSFFQTLLDWANASGVFTFISLPNMLDLCTFFIAFFFSLFFVASSTLPVCFFRLYFLTFFSMKFITYQMCVCVCVCVRKQFQSVC